MKYHPARQKKKKKKEKKKCNGLIFENKGKGTIVDYRIMAGNSYKYFEEKSAN